MTYWAVPKLCSNEGPSWNSRCSPVLKFTFAHTSRDYAPESSRPYSPLTRSDTRDWLGLLQPSDADQPNGSRASGPPRVRRWFSLGGFRLRRALSDVKLGSWSWPEVPIDAPIRSPP